MESMPYYGGEGLLLGGRKYLECRAVNGQGLVALVCHTVWGLGFSDLALEAQVPIYWAPVLKSLYELVLSVTQGPTIWVPGLLGLVLRPGLGPVQIMMSTRVGETKKRITSQEP